MAEKPIYSVKDGMVDPDIKMTGKTVIVTGANSGIGLETAIDLATRGAKVIMACRNMEKAEVAKKRVIEESKSELVLVKKLDLSSLESVREFAANTNANEERLDVLVNNAGIMMCPQSKTKEGFEMQFGTNHLGHFLLTNLLLDLLKKSAPSRVVILASAGAHKRFISKINWDDLNAEKAYDGQLVYCQSKLMNVMFSNELAKRLKGTEVTTYTVDPGAVKTNLQTKAQPGFNIFTIAIAIFRPFWRGPKKGAQTSIYCAVAPEIADKSGCYYKDCKQDEGLVNPIARDEEQNEKLWRISEEFVGLKPKEKKHEDENNKETEESGDVKHDEENEN